jgi:predicted kinase
LAALILTGPPGVGKTTVAGILTRRDERAVHVEADRFFYFIRSGLVEPWDPASREQNETVMRTAAAAAASYAAAGYSTVLEGIVIPRWTLGIVREAFESAGVRPAYAVLRAPERVCVARVEEREGDPDLLAPSVLARIGSEFDDLGEFEPHAIDVAGMDVAEAATAVSTRLADGTLDL